MENRCSHGQATRQRRIATIADRLDECDRRLVGIEADPATLKSLQAKLDRARARLDELRRPAHAEAIEDVTLHLATWAGNRSPAPVPRRPPSAPLFDPRRRR